MKFDNIHFILNPIAGNGKSKIAWTQIEEYLKQNKIPYFVHITENVGHAKTIAEELTSVSNTSNLLICVGGDGTLGEIINGFINFDKHLLSVIPSSGSGNDFASCTNIPNTGYLDSVKWILSNQSRQINFMILNKTTRVINVAGIGIDVDVLNRYYRMKRFKPKTRYKIATILQTLFFKWHKVLISIDDAPHIPIKTLLLSLGNGQSIGGGIKMCPQAKIDDDYLNLTYIGSFNRILALPKLKKVMKGKIEKLKCTKFYTCKKLSIILNGIGYQYDGNVVNNQNQVDICLANQKINFIG